MKEEIFQKLNRSFSISKKINKITPLFHYINNQYFYNLLNPQGINIGGFGHLCKPLHDVAIMRHTQRNYLIHYSFITYWIHTIIIDSHNL